MRKNLAVLDFIHIFAAHKTTNQISNNIKYKIMKTEVYIYNLNGNRAVVRDYAKTIAEMSATSSNAYVMAFDKDNEMLWTVQAGDDIDEVKAAINWQGVRRVEIYDHSANGTYKVENVYVTSQKSLTGFTSERSASEFVVVGNTTQYTADNWQKAEAEESDTQSDDNNEGKQTAAEPSALAQKVAKVAESVKTYAAHGARRVALLLSLLVVLVLSVGVVLGCVPLMLALFDALSITGAARVVLVFLVVLGPAMELGINIECNALAVVARLFPGSFPCRMPFECFSFWGRMLRA